MSVASTVFVVLLHVLQPQQLHLVPERETADLCENWSCGHSCFHSCRLGSDSDWGRKGNRAHSNRREMTNGYGYGSFFRGQSAIHCVDGDRYFLRSHACGSRDCFRDGSGLGTGRDLRDLDKEEQVNSSTSTVSVFLTKIGNALPSFSAIKLGRRERIWFRIFLNCTRYEIIFRILYNFSPILKNFRVSPKKSRNSHFVNPQLMNLFDFGWKRHTKENRRPRKFPELHKQTQSQNTIFKTWKDVADKILDRRRDCPSGGHNIRFSAAFGSQRVLLREQRAQKPNFLRAASLELRSGRYPASCSQPHSFDTSLEFITSLYLKRLLFVTSFYPLILNKDILENV